MAKRQNENCAISIARNPLAEGRQLELFNHTGNRHKPQISSIPGISPKQRDRYRVTLGNQVLGNFLTIDEALKLAKQGGEA